MISNQPAIINVKVNASLKKEAMEVVEELGISLSAFVNASLKTLVRARAVHFSLDSETPTDYTINELTNSKNDVDQGNVMSFPTTEDAISYVNKIVSARAK